MTPSGRRRLTAVAALLVAGGAVAYLAFGNMEKNLVYYWTPSDLLAKADTVKGVNIRLGGMVQQGTLDWDAKAMRLRFSMGEKPEAGGPSVEVVSSGAPPQMLREGIGCVVEGTFDGKVFHSDRLIVKHGNQYRPPKGGMGMPAADGRPATDPAQRAAAEENK